MEVKFYILICLDIILDSFVRTAMSRITKHVACNIIRLHFFIFIFNKRKKLVARIHTYHMGTTCRIVWATVGKRLRLKITLKGVEINFLHN